MRRYNILATAVGAVVGYGIIEVLRLSDYDVNVIGCDIFPDAVGRYMADDFAVACPAAGGGYIDFLKDLIDEKKIDLVLFGIEQEINAVSNARTELGEYLKKLVLNPKPIIDVCDDKWLTREWLFKNGMPEYAIDSVIGGDYADVKGLFGPGFLIKPRVSRAGKGIVRVESGYDFDYYKAKLGDNFMAQRIVGDSEREYTVGVFGTGDGEVKNIICLRRTLSQEGATAKAWVKDDPDIELAARRITAALCPEGPANYQFRKEDGRVFLLEINPRISSSVSIRGKFGYNEGEMCVDYYLEGKEPRPAVVKRGRAIRYIRDWIIEE